MADTTDDIAQITVGDAQALAKMYREWQAVRAGPEKAASQIGGLDAQLWLEITSFSGSTGPRTYTCDVYATPWSTSPLAEDVTAWNAWEIANDATHGSGYTLGTDDVSGFKDVPDTVRHQAIEFTYNEDADAWGYVFSCRQDPDITCP